MAAPTIAQTKGSSEETNGTTQNFDLFDSNPTAGNTLLLISALDGVPGISTDPSEFTQLGEYTNPGDCSFAVWYKEADGDESGGSLSYTIGSSERSATLLLEIAGADDPATNAPEAGTSVSGDGTTSIDPPSLTPSGGADDYLFIVVIAQDTGDESVSAWPTGYGSFVGNSTVNDAGGVTIGYTIKATTAASSDDPSSATISNSDAVTNTFCIYPAAGVLIPVFRRFAI